MAFPFFAEDTFYIAVEPHCTLNEFEIATHTKAMLQAERCFDVNIIKGEVKCKVPFFIASYRMLSMVNAVTVRHNVIDGELSTSYELHFEVILAALPFVFIAFVVVSYFTIGMPATTAAFIVAGVAAGFAMTFMMTKRQFATWLDRGLRKLPGLSASE